MAERRRRLVYQGEAYDSSPAGLRRLWVTIARAGAPAQNVEHRLQSVLRRYAVADAAVLARHTARRVQEQKVAAHLMSNGDL